MTLATFLLCRKTSLDSPLHEMGPNSSSRYMTAAAAASSSTDKISGSGQRSSSRHKRSGSSSSYQQQADAAEDYEYLAPTTRRPQPDIERPNTLELPMTPRGTPLRSSLKKNSSYPVYHNNTGQRWSGSGAGTSSGGTPTNPTPPDSVSEEGFHPATRSDSGFVSAGPVAGGANRVRFSPSPFEGSAGQSIVMQTDWSPTHPAGAGDTVRSRQVRNNQHHFVTESDLQRDFNIYP